MASKVYTITGTSPAAPGTAVLTKAAASTSDTTITGLDNFTTCVIHAQLVGATGGPLDVYVQSSIDGSSWYDVVHFTQLGAGAGAVRYFASVNRFPAGTPAIRTVNTADATPALGANSLVSEGLGNALRIVCVAGALTSASASLTFIIGVNSEPF
jgi:hypothetical protein